MPPGNPGGFFVATSSKSNLAASVRARVKTVAAAATFPVKCYCHISTETGLNSAPFRHDPFGSGSLVEHRRPSILSAEVGSLEPDFASRSFLQKSCNRAEPFRVIRDVRFSIRGVLLVGLAVAIAARAAETTPLTSDPLTAIEPLPELVSFAAAGRIPLRGIDLGKPGPSLEPQQNVTLLITLMKDETLQQWLIQLSPDVLTENERARRIPPSPLIHTSTGRSMSYAFAHAALRLELVGPFLARPRATEAATPEIPVRRARALVNGKFLEAGIAEYCRSGLDITRRIERAGIVNPVYTGGSTRPAPETLVQGRHFAAAIQLTEAEERAAFSVYFSLTTFFGAAMEISAVRELLEEVVDRPSLWSVVRHRGVIPSFNFFWTAARAVEESRAGLPDSPFQLPVQIYLNGKLGLKATLVVVQPRGPLTTCAGIVALCAEHPAKPARRLFIRVLSAQRAPGSNIASAAGR